MTGYKAIAALFGLPVFIGCWIYCIATYGFIVGVLIGWLPSLIVAAIAGMLWPVFALLIALFIANHR